MGGGNTLPPSGAPPLAAYQMNELCSFSGPHPGRGGRGAGRGAGRGMRGKDLFRSRKQNTSRPPSMHVDDFMAMENQQRNQKGPVGPNHENRDTQPGYMATRKPNMKVGGKSSSRVKENLVFINSFFCESLMKNIPYLY